MIPVLPEVKSLLENSVSLDAGVSCLLEYNMNEMINGVTILNYQDDGETEYNTVVATDEAGQEYKPYSKLFPITSVVDPRRPSIAGVKYFVLNNKVEEKIVNYSLAKDLSTRLYYPGTKMYYKYWLSQRTNDGTKVLENCNLVVDYPIDKNAACNKIVIKFETSHARPKSWTISTVDAEDNEVEIHSNGSIPANGVFELYYTGDDIWIGAMPNTIAEPIDISKIKVSVTELETADTQLGVIEISARYITDISNNIVSMTINKQSSNGSKELLPVGDVTSNSLSLDLNYYDGDVIDYDTSNAFDKTKLNLYKNIILYPRFRVGLHKIQQGVFYIESSSISEFGEVSIQALDGAKFLQEMFAPEMLLTNTTSHAIIRRLLDSVGFTNYVFLTNEKDSSTITPTYWWTDTTQTVWQHIQELCHDTQMVASFDENDRLVFFTRENIFSAKTPQLKFRYDGNAYGLPNIVNLLKENVPSAKSAKVLWSSRLSNAYQPYTKERTLWVSPPTILKAGALAEDLPAVAPESDGAPKGSMKLYAVTTDLQAEEYAYDHSGYVLLDKEIIEYDALKYSYLPIGASVLDPRTPVWIESPNDLMKAQGLAEPMTFKFIHEYRIKTRNAFQAIKDLPEDTGEDHYIDVDLSKWSVIERDYVLNEYGEHPELIQNTPSSSKDNYIPRSMLTVSYNGKYDAAKPKYVFATKEGKFSGDNNIIGTSLFFSVKKDPSTGKVLSDVSSIGGVAFYLDETCNNGYYLQIETFVSAGKDLATEKYKLVKLFKIKDGKMSEMVDSQRTEEQKAWNISGGKMYKVEIKINETLDKDTNKKYAVFKILIDNTSIIVADKDPLTATDKIALVCAKDMVHYDYVYTAGITGSEFADNSPLNISDSYLPSNSTLINLFSDYVFNAPEDKVKEYDIEEFGPVARDIKKINVKFNQPGMPNGARITLNPYATVIGSALDSFGLEAYVLNNSGTYATLADNNKSFSVYGNEIIQSDQFEYYDKTITDKEKSEQVGFESIWIQKEEEAKALYLWIKDQWSKNQTVVSLETFFNPIIQIGDIVEISYPRNNLYSSEDTLEEGQSAAKYVVLDVSQSWQQGGTTSLVCRSIYTA